MKTVVNRFNQDLLESMSIIKRSNPKEFNEAMSLV